MGAILGILLIEAVIEVIQDRVLKQLKFCSEKKFDPIGSYLKYLEPQFRNFCLATRVLFKNSKTSTARQTASDSTMLFTAL